MHAQRGKILFERAALGAPAPVVDARCAAASGFRSLADELVDHVRGAIGVAGWAEGL